MCIRDRVYEQAWAPYAAGTMPVDEALKTGVQPLREFMLKLSLIHISEPTRPY